jgi:cation transport regulator ChaC
MSDLNLIRTIEKKIYKKLKEGSNEDYLFDKSGNLIHLNLSDCEINNLSELIPYILFS